MSKLPWRYRNTFQLVLFVEVNQWQHLDLVKLFLTTRFFFTLAPEVTPVVSVVCLAGCSVDKCKWHVVNVGA